MEERPQAPIAAQASQAQVAPSRLSSASDVIDALGGTNSVAEMLDIGASSVSNYRKQGFPARSHFILAKICAERGLDVADAVFGGYQLQARPKAYQRAAASSALASAAASPALTQLEQAGFKRVSLPILQPAAPFIDRMGPEMQRRLFTFTDPGGEQLCLRPDLTIPTALAHIASGQSGEARYCYQGTAFRYQPRGSGQPEEFTQLGMEIIGGGNGLDDDLAVLETIINTLRQAGLTRNLRFVCADFDMMTHFLTALDMSSQARDIVWRLINRAQDADDFKKLASLQTGDKNAAAEAAKRVDVNAMIAGRSGSEILARLSRLDGAALDADSLDAVHKFLAYLAAPNGMAEISTAFPQMKSWFETRTAQLGSVILPAMAGAAEMSDISFAPIIARGMAYYTGLSFEIYAQGIDRPIAAGGRYDDLLQSLGAPQPLSAIGGAIALERLNKAVEMQS
ncbi:ATP phosphoribosyltransferase regulatory subunit [Alphaproteobacteria bacterium]|nr:ATP phosphoribosyltransferase regulatory subunit [Alphaproteobacteria bacterium]